MIEPEIGEWVVVTGEDPLHPGKGPQASILKSRDGYPPMRYCVSWPDDPRGVGHWWCRQVRLATPEEIAGAQLTSGRAGGL